MATSRTKQRQRFVTDTTARYDRFGIFAIDKHGRETTLQGFRNIEQAERFAREYLQEKGVPA